MLKNYVENESINGNDCGFQVRHLLCSHYGPLLSFSVCADGIWTVQRKRKEVEEEAWCFLKELSEALGCEAAVIQSEFLYLSDE